MAVRVRLTRVGSRKNPVWRVVVADQRSPRDGRIIEQIGHYDPHPQPSTIVIDRERLDHWLALGAEPTNTVRKLMRAPLTAAGKAAAAEAEPAPGPAPETAEPAAAADAPAAASEDAPVEVADPAESP